MNETIRCIVSALTVAVIAFGATPVAAQSIDSPYRFVETSQSLGVFGGNMFTGRGALELGPESAPAFGLRYNLRVTGPFNVEGSILYMSSTRTVLDTVPADTALRVLGETDMTVLAATAALRFDITGPRTWNRLQPYVALGGGLALDLAGEGEVEEDLAEDAKYDFGTRFLASAGGGIEVHLSPRLTGNVDGRALLWKLNTPDAFLQDEASLTRPPDEWTQNFVLSAGLSFRF